MITNPNNSSELIDRYGRKISYLRVSLTPRCNFRCGYCYTKNDPQLQKQPHLSDDEFNRIIKSFTHLGVNKIRLTGGEPLLHPTLIELLRRINTIPEIELIGITTNGYFLGSMLSDLIEAGLNRVNISLDSLCRETFQKITGVDGLSRVLEAIDKAESSGAFPRIKVNTVLIRDVNDNELGDFAQWALERRIDLRLIEYMPTHDTDWEKDKFISETEVCERLGFNLIEVAEESDNSGPAKTYKVAGYPGRISFISAISRKSCRTCNRIRLTSSGDLMGCLFKEHKTSLLPILGESNTNEDLTEFIQELIVDQQFRNSPYKNYGMFRPLMVAVGG